MADLAAAFEWVGNTSFRARGQQLDRIAVLMLQAPVDFVQSFGGDALLNLAGVVMVKFHHVGGLPGNLDCFLVPAGVNDS